MRRLSQEEVGLIFAAMRALQWLSAAIVMGISAYFIAVGPRHQHALYWEILVSLTKTTPSGMVKLTSQSAISVVIFLLASIFSYLLFRNMGKYTWAYYVVFAVDFAFSYLCVSPILNAWSSIKTYRLYRWLTTFIFAAQDYNLNDCKLGFPRGISCAVKKANESFMFITL